jgi:hypothetical protein
VNPTAGKSARVRPDNAPLIIDPLRGGTSENADLTRQRIIDGGIAAIVRVVEEAVALRERDGKDDRVRSNDLAPVIDVLWCGGPGSAAWEGYGARIVEGGDGVDGHDPYSWLAYTSIEAVQLKTYSQFSEVQRLI